MYRLSIASRRLAIALLLSAFGCAEADPLLDAGRASDAGHAEDAAMFDGGSIDPRDAAAATDTGNDAPSVDDGRCAPEGTYVTVSVTPDVANAASCRAPSASAPIVIDANGIPSRNLCDDDCGCDISPAVAPSCSATLRYACATPLDEFEMAFDGDELTTTIRGAFVEGEPCRFVIVARRS